MLASNSTPRVNFEQLERFPNRSVLLVAQVTIAHTNQLFNRCMQGRGLSALDYPLMSDTSVKAVRSFQRDSSHTVEYCDSQASKYNSDDGIHAAHIRHEPLY
jgi:hypothetical protein